MGSAVHELLRGGRSPYPSTFSRRQMASLVAICDTFLPAMAAVEGGSEVNDAIEEFFGTSASMAGVPEHVAGMLYGRLKHPAIKLLPLLFWILSTPWGTLALCGRHSFSRRFPYLMKFKDIKQKDREKILLSWSSSSLLHYTMAFNCLKYVITDIYFTKVDKENHNPSWRALDYCGPDPRPPNTRQGQNLHKHVVDAAEPDKCIVDAFLRAGFDATTPSGGSSLRIRCDAVVVGSGSGGGVAAGVVAGEGWRVVVVEKGRWFGGEGLSLLEGPSMDEMYESSGLLATDDLGALVMAGATVGGGSAVNWAAALRTPRHVREEWNREHGLDLFTSRRFEKALDVVCDRLGVQEEVAHEGFSSSVLRRGCEALNYPVAAVPRNSPKDHSCGWCHLGCRDGQKRCTQQTWLDDMARSGKGVILQNSTASKVLIRRPTKKQSSKSLRPIAAGILVELPGTKRLAVIESRVTVVAAGALNTPPLLRRSGLRNKHIGRHLHLHPCVMAWGYFPENQNWPEKHKKSYDGPILTSMSTVVANFDTTGYGAIIQTPALHPGAFSMLTPWLSSLDYKTRLLRFPRTAHLFALARDRGSGSAASYPNSLTYKSHRSDRENLTRGVEAMLRILVAAGATVVGTHHRWGKVLDVGREGSERVDAYVREESERAGRGVVCSAHQMGSCRMGRSAEVSAVGPEGETWEVEGLFVADTSVFPTAVGVNPMVTVQAIAYCTANAIAEKLKKVP